LLYGSFPLFVFAPKKSFFFRRKKIRTCCRQSAGHPELGSTRFSVSCCQFFFVRLKFCCFFTLDELSEAFASLSFPVPVAFEFCIGLTRVQPELANRVTKGRCYDHNFLRFSPIFCKNGVFLKNHCSGQVFAEFSFVLSQKHNFCRFFTKTV
jgi:hypothetical protein